MDSISCVNIAPSNSNGWNIPHPSVYLFIIFCKKKIFYQQIGFKFK